MGKVKVAKQTEGRMMNVTPKAVNQEVVRGKINALPWETLTHSHMCDKKQIVRVSAEAIVAIAE